MASSSPQRLNVLALDTASPRPAASLVWNGVLSSELLSSDRRASEELLPAIERLLVAEKAALKDLDRIAVCAGPGSFTGLRIGLATAWGLSQGSGVGVEPVSTLEALAESARTAGAGRIAAALDAGRGEVVLALYDLTEKRARPLSAPQRLPRDQARERCRQVALACLPENLLEIGSLPIAEPLSAALARAVSRAPGPEEPLESAAVYSRVSAAEEKLGAP
jgi:tRNA threonylcarbamoyladenosine biosynthesis protein TsaB